MIHYPMLIQGHGLCVRPAWLHGTPPGTPDVSGLHVAIMCHGSQCMH